MYSHYNRYVADSQWFDNKYANAFTLYSWMCSHYVLCVFFKYKTRIHGSNKTLDFSVRIKIDNESKAKLYIYYFYCLRIKLSKIFINFDSICYPFWFEPKIWISVTLRNKSNTKIQYPKKKQITNTNIFRNIYLIRSVICIYIYICKE